MLDKTFTFKGKELRVTDNFIDLDLNEIPYGNIESVALKPAVFGVRGELRIKVKDRDVEKYSFGRVVNKQVSSIAVMLVKKADIKLTLVKKGRSRLPFVIAPVCLLIAAVVVVIVLYNQNNNGGGADGNIDPGWDENGMLLSELPDDADISDTGNGDITNEPTDTPDEPTETPDAPTVSDEPDEPEETDNPDDEELPIETDVPDDIDELEPAPVLDSAAFLASLNEALESAGSVLRADFINDEPDDSRTIGIVISDASTVSIKTTPEVGGLESVVYHFEAAGTKNELEALICMVAVITAIDTETEPDAALLLSQLLEGEGTASLGGFSYSLRRPSEAETDLIIKPLP